jgi:hypothetical protein
LQCAALFHGGSFHGVAVRSDEADDKEVVEANGATQYASPQRFRIALLRGMMRTDYGGG